MGSDAHVVECGRVWELPWTIANSAFPDLCRVHITGAEYEYENITRCPAK